MIDYIIPLCEGETLDMGSFTLTGHDKGIYEFKGLSADIGKLPKVQSIGTGSIAYCVDTGVLLMYEKTSKTWYEQ